ncbi:MULTISPECIES: hypothetical protein [Nocardiopsis]|uniref:Uncharacterized protein n=1 Tax=Nocardiopsis changdeensis TaxID=2831969 RepID=A0ABX8BZW2_9ACTN|nr:MULTISPECIES: hypothetical protein [Nocardiopsis]QUX26376.1 hypothetical protein KGD84_32265 [Nocardiopsis changdeensis]QYX40804.1 hypothetical protein K1J57_32910 [Nocardiopsis sp. MT53]
MLDLLERLAGLVRDRIHGECYELIAHQHDAVSASAAAHHQAEAELAAARVELAAALAENTTLRALLDGAAAPADRA